MSSSDIMVRDLLHDTKKLQEVVLAHMERSIKENYEFNIRYGEFLKEHTDVPRDIAEGAKGDDILLHLISYTLTQYYRGYLSVKQCFDVALEFVVTMQMAEEKYEGSMREYYKGGDNLERACGTLVLYCHPKYMNKDLMFNIFANVLEVASEHGVNPAEVYADEMLYRKFVQRTCTRAEFIDEYTDAFSSLIDGDEYFREYVLPRLKMDAVKLGRELTDDEIMAQRMNFILEFCEEHPERGVFVKSVKEFIDNHIETQAQRFFG